MTGRRRPARIGGVVPCHTAMSGILESVSQSVGRRRETGPPRASRRRARKRGAVGDLHEELESQEEPSSPTGEPGGSVVQDSAAGSPSDERLAVVRRRVEELPADGSIRVVFQPIVDLATTKVIGYEALARFPGDSNVSPRTWFAEAAEVGLLIEIEMTAIRAALAHLERLPKDSFISVNVSPSTAGSEELRDALGSVDPRRVVLEITENAAAEVDEEVGEAVGALRATGVRIALDDTGSGSVSFTSLFDVHADIIKIDIDVIHGIASDPVKEAMAAALKALADRLGAMSLAEGIETEEELNLLRGVGVQAGQGYLFGRPAPVGD